MKGRASDRSGFTKCISARYSQEVQKVPSLQLLVNDGNNEPLSHQRSRSGAERIPLTERVVHDGSNFQLAEKGSSRLEGQNRMQSFRFEGPQPIENYIPSGTARKDVSNTNCLICYDGPPDAVIMNCGHGGLCYNCAIEMWNKNDECFLCRERIVQILQISLTTRHEEEIKVVGCTQKVEVDEDESVNVL
eukprot:TRINITY_DN9652_c0_g1_i3.p1 TRINITY_DN9652_c0_g1~~TRINITY_DN9652_c0_g1_i3.p1  ORF type:complete len:190 (+),score=21.32 TRINITY_DN9652_c0_g1_i3:591-1160(+)